MTALRLLTILAVLASPLALVAQGGTQIRLATVLPAGSLWDKALRQMGADWAKATDGRVQLRIFPGGAQGSEPTVVTKMRLNNPQAASLTQPGLAHIDEAFNVFGVPFFFQSDEELRYVLEKLAPRLTEALADEGLVLVNWGHGGWAHIFAKSQVKDLDDLKRMKLFTTAGDDDMVQWYKQNGFEPVPLALTDVLLGLNTGLITAYPSPPYAALLLQWYTKTPHMLDLPLGPVIGATVVTDMTWKRLSDMDRRAILEIANASEDRLMTEVPTQDRSSVEEMKKRGLSVMTLDERAVADFRAAAEKLARSMRGTMVPADVYDLAVRARDEFRAGTR